MLESHLNSVLTKSHRKEETEVESKVEVIKKLQVPEINASSPGF